MRIKELRFQNFKRFTDLQIKNIPAEAKLVLLIGANGSGKSSVFDAFEWSMKNSYTQTQTVISKIIDDSSQNFGRVNRNFPILEEPSEHSKTFIEDSIYYNKNVKESISVEIIFDKIGEWSKNLSSKKIINLPKNIFFGRPSMRIVPRLINDRFDERSVETNSDGPHHFIDFDTRFQSDVKKFTWDINKALRDPLFLGDTTVDLRIIAQRFITPINLALERIFSVDKKKSIRIANYREAGNAPSEPPQLIFSKGDSLINYDLLSHGEKQVIIILLNLVMRSEFFQDTIYYIDEMDVHLNTTLQYALLKEITENWIPENCQLWTASHSLGFIEYAKDTDHSVIIDFDNLDFDETQVLQPVEKHLDEIFEVAIPRASISKILGNRKIVLCENKNYELYSLMGLDNYVFTDVQNSNSVFLKIKRDKSILGLRDRDYLTDIEIQRLKEYFPNYKILKYYCFENYLYHPENLMDLKLIGFDKEAYEKEIREIKNKNRHTIVVKISESRKSYEEFRDGGIKMDSLISTISQNLESDDFETFYTFFSFKDYCGELINKYKIDKKEIKEKLAQTEWFKKHLTDILS